MIDRQDYLLLLKKHLEQDYSDTRANILRVTDPDVLLDFEKKTGYLVGMLDNQPYYNFCMDVFKDNQSGQYFRYCNVSYCNNGAAILVVLRSNEDSFFLLNHQYRITINKTVYEIPRGFKDLNDMNCVDTALRELAEETGIDVRKKDVKLKKLGTVHPDSGLSNNAVSLYMIEIPLHECPTLRASKEEHTILEHHIVSENEFVEMIEEDRITDAFTLAAFIKYKCGKEWK